MKSSSFKEMLRLAFNNLHQIEKDYDLNYFKKFYVDKTRDFKKPEILHRLESSNNPQLILFSGQVGTGKTTELQDIKKSLEEKSEYYVILISLFRDGIATNDLKYTDILLTIFSHVLNTIPEDIEIPKKMLEKIKSLISKLSNTVSKEHQQGSLKSLTVSLLGLITLNLNKSENVKREFRVRTEEQISEIVDLFDEVLNIIRNTTRQKILIIVDDLEKIVGNQVIAEFIIDHGELIKRRDCSFIITISTFVRFNPRGTHMALQVDSKHCLPFIPVRNEDKSINSEGIDSMKDIIYKRVPKEIIDDKGLELAILYSGGSISELLKLYQNTILNIFDSDQHMISSSIVKDSFYDMRQDALFIHPAKFRELQDMNRLNQNYRDKISPNELAEYLYNCILLTYRNSKNKSDWYGLNPAYYDSESLNNLESNYL